MFVTRATVQDANTSAKAHTGEIKVKNYSSASNKASDLNMDTCLEMEMDLCGKECMQDHIGLGEDTKNTEGIQVLYFFSKHRDFCILLTN